MKHLRLMTPGPVDCYEDVLAEMAVSAPPHYGKEWMAIYRETIELLQWVFQTQNDLYIMIGPGTMTIEAGISSLVRTGERALVLANGFFADRLAVVARMHGIDAVVHKVPWGKPVDPDDVRRVLAREKGLQAVIGVHHETSTTVVSPIAEIARAAHEFDLPIVVDAVSSMGGMPVPVDEWDLDICVTVANKCMETPPGLAPISIGPRAWRMMDAKPDMNHGWYLDLRTWRDYAVRWGSWHPYPTTHATNNILALRASLRKMAAEGLERRYARYAQAAAWVRGGLTALGFDLFVTGEFASPLCTGAYAMPDFALSEYQNYLKKEHGIMIAGGLEGLAGKMFRVGHMGKAATREYVSDFLLSTEDFLRRQGREVPQGAAVAGIL